MFLKSRRGYFLVMWDKYEIGFILYYKIYDKKFKGEMCEVYLTSESFIFLVFLIYFVFIEFYILCDIWNGKWS